MRPALPLAKPFAPTLPSAGIEKQSKFWLAAVLVERLVTRMFTEKVPILPGWFNYLDVVVLAVLTLHVAFATRHTQRRPDLGFRLPVVLLLMWVGFSAVANTQRVEFAPATLFVFGLLEPLLFMWIVYTFRPGGSAAAFVGQLLYWLGWLQIVVVGVVDLPLFLSTGNPDYVSGTFGDNPYQLVHFLLAWNALFLFREVRQAKRSWLSLRVVAVQGLVLTIILLAQFRSLLPTILLTWLVTTLLVLPARMVRVTAALVAASLFAVIFLAIQYAVPSLKWHQALELFSRSDETLQSGKVQAVLNYGRMVNNDPLVLIIGTGPGTYASRGFRTFSIAGSGDIANTLYRDLLHRDYYTTDVAERYVLPVANLYAFGAATTAVPWFSYLAIPAELGIPGLALVLLLYGRALHRLHTASRDFRPMHTHTASLAVFAFVSLLVILQMGLLENWLETSRLTVPAWTVTGIVLSRTQEPDFLDSSNGP